MKNYSESDYLFFLCIFKPLDESKCSFWSDFCIKLIQLHLHIRSLSQVYDFSNFPKSNNNYLVPDLLIFHVFQFHYCYKVLLRYFPFIQSNWKV